MVRRHDKNNYRTRIHRMKRGVYRDRDGQRSLFWEMGCSLCIMTGPRAASAGFLLYLHVWMGFQSDASRMAGSQPLPKDTGRDFPNGIDLITNSVYASAYAYFWVPTQECRS